ncbi:MAG: ribose-5-phosphate isomerase [Frankiaceae bacterium]|jgi:ribose 5-phosphate isomerase B|nr:ribose-5-phosphate isomerase [Frankiaceae bacterium]
MRVYLGSDHAGFELKQAAIARLRQQGREAVDCGALVYEPDDDYPPFCIEAARRAVADPGSLAVVIGGSGNGEQIAANKVEGARCALAWSIETARLARAHNDANVVAIGARMHSAPEALGILDEFLATPFSEGERHIRRIGLLSAYERAARGR